MKPQEQALTPKFSIPEIVRQTLLSLLNAGWTEEAIGDEIGQPHQSVVSKNLSGQLTSFSQGVKLTRLALNNGFLGLAVAATEGTSYTLISRKDLKQTTTRHQSGVVDAIKQYKTQHDDFLSTVIEAVSDGVIDNQERVLVSCQA